MQGLGKVSQVKYESGGRMPEFPENITRAVSGSQCDRNYHPYRWVVVGVDVIDFHQHPIHVLTDAPQPQMRRAPAPESGSQPKINPK